MGQKLNHNEVKVGQRWRDCDKRMGERYVHIVRIEGNFAVCASIRKGIRSERYVKIRLNRFHPCASGYRLVTD
jgi:hypothetical protein